MSLHLVVGKGKEPNKFIFQLTWELTNNGIKINIKIIFLIYCFGVNL